MNNNNQNEEKQKIKKNKDNVNNKTNNKKQTAKKDVSKIDNKETTVSKNTKNTSVKKQTINKDEQKKSSNLQGSKKDNSKRAGNKNQSVKENDEKTNKQAKKNNTEKTNSTKKNMKIDNQKTSTKNQASKKKTGEINGKKSTEKKITRKVDNNKKTKKENNKKIENKNQTPKKDIKETSNTKRTVNKDNPKVNKSKTKANNNVKNTNTSRPSINDSIQRLNNSKQKMSSDIQRVYLENQKIKEEKRIIEEESKKVKHLKLIVNIAMIILIILMFIFFVYPGILIKNIRNSNNSQLAQNSINEHQNDHVEQLDETVNNIKFTDIAIATEGDLNLIIGKYKNETWEEILKVDNETNVLGTYKNKVYYYNSKGLSYIDLTKEEYEETEWIKYKQYKISDTGELGNLSISKATMIDDTIYFEYSIGAGGTLPTDGILSITTNSKSFDNAIQLISDVDKGNWQVDANNKLIYYIQFGRGKSGTLYQYDLTTNQNEKVFDNVESFKIYENKILYYILNNSVTSTETGIYPATYDLYLYNIDNKENKLIYVSSLSNINSGNLWSFAEYYNDDVYYKDGTKIIKYNNGEKNTIYTYSSNHGGDYLYGFYFIDKNIIELVIQNGNKKYLVNGNISDKPAGISTINVKMKDGTKKEFRVDKVK